MQSAHPAVAATVSGGAASATRSPAETARETLRQLAGRKLVPTPDNYQRVYEEISGTLGEPHGEGALEPLLCALHDLKTAHALLTEPAARMHEAVRRRDWTAFSSELVALRSSAGGSETTGHDVDADAVAWPEAIRELLKQYVLRHAAVSPKQKHEGLERVLGAFGRSPHLKDRLVGLVRSWGATRASGTDIATAASDPRTIVGTLATSTGDAAASAAPGESASPSRITDLHAVAHDEASTPAPDNPHPMPLAAGALSRLDMATIASGSPAQMLRQLLAEVLRHDVAPRFSVEPSLSNALLQLAEEASQADSVQACAALAERLADFWEQADQVQQHDGLMVEDLMGLVRLLVENIGELVDDDQWIGGQVEVMRQIMAQPLTPKLITDAQTSFRQIVLHQGTLKHSLADAKNTLKDMIGVFVERLSAMSRSTTEYHEKIGAYVQQIERTDDIGSLREVLDGLMGDIRTMHVDALRSREDVVAARDQAHAAEDKIRQLETELEEISEKVREDALTGSLNRRGLDEALTREAARAQRYGNAFCVAVIDLDNFKKLNDTHGHQAGDQALVHLVRVVKTLLRPSDHIGRFGGEEFVVLLPETTLQAGKLAIERLQRELTKQFFLANNEKLLITFSAGVAQLRRGETEGELVKRADQAMYQAKQTGKNRVSIAT
ncbi:MAG: diguanylate cyclase [Proteobacteria bacterium]|nr:diguanylate cyclase [Burkholderiales bacterium]